MTTYAPDSDALTGGRWERRPGGLRVWIADAEPERIETVAVYRVSGVICECGCLLRDDRELCPACVIPWCEKAAEHGRRLQQERAWRRADLSYLRLPNDIPKEAA